MKMSLKKQFENHFDDPSRDITKKTQAAVNLVKAAEAMGVLDRLLLVLSLLRGKLGGETTDSSRPGERRIDTWRGDELSAFSARTDTGESGESYWLDRMGDKLWSRFRQKKKRPRRPKRRGKESRER
jgi:hypothetical protein